VLCFRHNYAGSGAQAGSDGATSAPAVGTIATPSAAFDSQLTLIEQEMTRAVKAMPAEKFGDDFFQTPQGGSGGRSPRRSGAYWLTRFLAGFLFGVQSRDPAAFLAVPLFLSLIALIAAWVTTSQRYAASSPARITLRVRGMRTTENR